MLLRSRFLVLVALALAPGAIMTAAIPGCGGSGEIYSCVDPIPDRKDHNGHPDPCCYVDPCHDEDAGANDSSIDAPDDAEGGPPAADAASDAQADANPAACPGACIDAPPLGWSEPVLLSLRATGTAAPACPAEAPVVGFQGFADLVAPPASCGTCSCGLATATCALPTSSTASSADCAGGGVTASFDPPDSWDGTCTTSNAIPADPLCTGPCTKSLTTGPLTILDESCPAVTTPPLMPTPPSNWQTAAVACKRGSAIACDDPMQACAPVAEAPAGFELCVYESGDLECPPSFPNKHVAATGIDDQRACSPCACGEPAGGLCTAWLYVFGDDACGGMPDMKVIEMQISSQDEACADLTPAGQALGSKYVDKVKYIPGSCAPSGGEATGQAVPGGVATFCCRT